VKRIADIGLRDSLSPFGFEAGKAVSWLRNTGELLHVIALVPSYGSRVVQWGVVSAEIVPMLWAEPIDDRSVAASAMTGVPSDIHHPPACSGFSLDAQVTQDQIEELGAALATDALRFEAWVRDFTTRRELRDYLLENRDVSDPRGFLIPSGLSLKLFTAAALAVADRDPAACGLIVETEQAMSVYRGDKATAARMRRLNEAAKDLCSCGSTTTSSMHISAVRSANRAGRTGSRSKTARAGLRPP
jgi:hypothetical protein